PTHMDTIRQHGIIPIDLLCVNLYPFAQTVAKAGVALEEAIENIDIGGPAMIRSASKNHDAVTVLVEPEDYASVLAELRERGETTLETRRKLAAKAYAHTARYDTMISSYLAEKFELNEPFPQTFAPAYVKVQDCRY